MPASLITDIPPLADVTVLPGASWLVLFTLALITAASTAMFSLLVRRWTTRRQWVSLNEWARRRRLKVLPGDSVDALPALLSSLTALSPRVRLRLGDGVTSIVQFDLNPATTERSVGSTLESSGPWNVLIRNLSSGKPYAAAALRPASLPVGDSAIDLFQLTPFHSLANDRFTVLASDSRSANELFSSSARALLPADVGIFMYDRAMLLDFSSRPFDPVELDRMIAVSEQICVMC